jgi:hypothetical protein
MCPMRGAVPWGDVIDPTADRRCGRCGWANFRYGEMSLSGIRGYRCVGCGAIKAENRVEVATVTTVDAAFAELVVVKLDDPKFGGGPGTVIAHVASSAEYLDRFADRDGCLPADLRMWRGPAAIGARVKLAESGPLTFQARPERQS